MSIKIDKGIPIPPNPSGRPTGSKYPLRDMQVGDSFFVANTTSQRVCGTMGNLSKRVGIKVAIRKVTENGVAGVRVWRVA